MEQKNFGVVELIRLHQRGVFRLSAEIVQFFSCLGLSTCFGRNACDLCALLAVQCLNW